MPFSLNAFVSCDTFPRMSTQSTLSPGHVIVPSLMIGTMAVGLSVGMDSLGFWNALDERATAWTISLGDGMRDVPAHWVLILTVVSSFLLPFLMLSTPQWWRRLVLWLSFLLITIAWMPVLALASWKLPPSMPIIALLWSGLCAIIYAKQHRLPCEEMPAPQRKVKEVPVKEN
jgi:hypothetical protein